MFDEVSAISISPASQVTATNENINRVTLGNDEAYFLAMNFKSLASRLYPPFEALPTGSDRYFDDIVDLPESIKNIRVGYRYIYIVDPMLAYKDSYKPSRLFGEKMFDDWRGTKNTESFCAGMNYASSQRFDVGNFDCIKEIYRRVGYNAKLCVPAQTRDFLVVPVSAESCGAKYSVMKRYKEGSICFNMADRTLNIKQPGDVFRGYQFKAGIGEIEKKEFIDSLKTTDRLVAPEKLAYLFEYIKYSLPDGERNNYVSASYGPGYAQMYFPKQEYPSGFPLGSRPTIEEMEFMHSFLGKNDAGYFRSYQTNYQNEAQITKLYEAAFKKYLIANLKNIADPDEQIALISGFASTMVHLHFFNDKNNRIWTQILLNHLLRSCGLSDSILAVPNGFAHAIRYCWIKGGAPAPGTPEYIEVMRPAISAIRDGMAYYRSVCA
ncbi:hypothetical protein [Pandoraea oxalativorans]|uniref:Uncharacterized protein n=1 Tax=Pandoraea oxalativorans TaxID=573737 RepID=A0A0G3IBH6_9BURK|nr:hypothetical protein [Pandoraea oxalativorans]AKK24622.1 hypothetical protein MB84_27665 [Pandoraea oxalativorans]